jgi:hypothetical protein
MDEKRFTAAIDLFDRANAQDPNKRELDYAKRVFAWVQKLSPHASEALLLASRCQHLMRWKVPRGKFPEGKAGYLKWRKAAAQFHADESAKILRQVGYSDTVVKRVQELNLKKGLGSDAEVQTLEDALCLVFLETQFHEFKSGKDETKIVEIVRKTWEKMSPRAREIAQSLPLSKDDKSLLAKALG